MPRQRHTEREIEKDIKGKKKERRVSEQKRARVRQRTGKKRKI